MGSIVFSPGTLADQLSELAGYKAGLALSIPELCDHLTGSSYPDLILASETGMVRLRAEEYEAIFYKLLHRIGYTKEEYNGDYTGAFRFRKYKTSGQLEEFMQVMAIYRHMWPDLVKATREAGSKAIDPRPFLAECKKRLGHPGFDMAVEQLEVLERAMTLNPHVLMRSVEWTSAIEVRHLFEGGAQEPEHGRFIDQRYVDYLAANADRVGQIHWRAFEQLTAEFFERDGFRVELGSGANDDGVDVRVWRPDAAEGQSPLCIVQCKRQQAKVDKVVVKGLFADVQFEKAEYGVIVTTSSLSPGAKTTISARGYPLEVVEREGVLGWLEKLRTPGTVIVR